MQKITPTAALEILGHIAALEWKPLTAQDYSGFADAGPDARIAELSDSRSARIAELLNMPNSGLLAIIGGDSLQIELHGCTDDGEPVSASLPLNFNVETY